MAGQGKQGLRMGQVYGCAGKGTAAVAAVADNVLRSEIIIVETALVDK